MRVSILIAVLAASAAVPTSAQERDFSKVEIKTEQLAPGVAVLFGAGGNIGVSYGSDGTVLIDDQFAPLTDKITAAVTRLRSGPVRFLVNTHWHGDHTGGNENLGRAGAVIMAHDNVRARMAVEQISKRFGTTPASPGAALPVITFGDGVTLHLNGDTLHVLHASNAHTDGDSLIHWQKADVLHMGDTFFHKVTLPFIDLDSGGSIDGMIAAADKGLALAGPNTKIIPGHGPIASRADLLAYRAMLVDIRSRIAAGIAAGRTLDQIKASNPIAGRGPSDGFISPDQLVESIYRSLTSPPTSAQPHKH